MPGDNAAERVAARLRVMADRAAGPAPKAAIEASTRAAETITKLALSQYSHSAGTPTPSPPGSPPAIVSGKGRQSIHRSPAARVAPATYVQTLGSLLLYMSVQERGAVIRVKSKRVLANVQTGQVFGPGPVTIPARPWLKPSVEIWRSSGAGARAAREAFVTVIFADL